MSGAGLVDNGNRVIFESAGGYDASHAVHVETGDSISFTRRNNVYEVNFAVRPFELAAAGVPPAAPLGGPTRATTTTWTSRTSFTRQAW